MNALEPSEIDMEDKITEVAYISRGLAYVLFYAISETSPENDPCNPAHDFYLQVCVLCEKLDELSKISDWM